MSGRLSAELVRRHLLDRMDEDAASGARLPTERALATKVGVPRSAVRNALSRLEAEGRLFRVGGSGTYVAPAADPKAGSTEKAEASPQEIMDARLLVEPRLAAWVVACATAADILKLEDCCTNMEASTSLDIYETWDQRLHQGIADATHNRAMIQIYGMITALRSSTEWGNLKRRTIAAEQRNVDNAEHREIVRWLKERDAARAEATIASHLKRVRQNIFGSWGE